MSQTKSITRYEDAECLVFANYLKNQSIPFHRYACEIPTNNFAVIGRMRKEGWRAGVPDFHIYVPNGGYHGLWIEMKSDRASFPTENTPQHKTLMELASYGHLAYCTRGAKVAIELTTKYIEEGKCVPEYTVMSDNSQARKPKQMIRCYNYLLENKENES